MKKINLVIVFALLFGVLRSQTAIDFHFPAAAGFDYCFVLERGSVRDTVARGSFDAEGKGQALLPPDRVAHRGVGKLFLTGAKSPMINMILDGEKNVTVSGEVNNPTYENSPENATLQRFMNRQNELLQQYIVTIGSLEESGGVNTMSLDTEKRQVEQEYDSLSAEITATPLYAGTIMQILRYLTFTGSSLRQTPEDVKAELRNFIVNKLDFSDLYVSGFWGLTFDAWYENNLTESDSLLVAEARTMLSRADKEISRPLSQAIINVLSKYSVREYLLPEILPDVQYPVLGQSAPAIICGSDSIAPRNALIIFYNSDCSNCQLELHNLVEKFNLLKDNKIRVISIAADTDKAIFADTASSLPWTDKLCDFKGFDGVNFKNYGVVGTPTFILIDQEGILRGRYARMGEIIKE